MFKKMLWMTMFGLLLPVAAQCAETNTDDDLFATDEGDFLTALQRSTPANTQTATLSEFIMQNITAATAIPINKAEKVYCYVVDYAVKDGNEYTANGLAIKGYCGELSPDGRSLIKEALFNSSNAYSQSRANCNVSPKIMLRYVFGIDHTDVLLSNPCPSVTFFHDNSIAVMNAEPGAAIIEKIIDVYTSLREDFHSPALLGQMVGNGVPQNQAQKEIIRRNTPSETSRKKWNNDTPQETSAETDPTASKPATGWNRLK